MDGSPELSSHIAAGEGYTDMNLFLAMVCDRQFGHMMWVLHAYWVCEEGDIVIDIQHSDSEDSHCPSHIGTPAPLISCNNCQLHTEDNKSFIRIQSEVL